ncbi:hypothetical protein [Vibrio sp. 10N.261.51.F12]|uniref:hypothetical protein n=1 Tax=Vibrio sp. 10N.261.51.F12 TaxID=3229679 RepID=UPI00354C8285
MSKCVVEYDVNLESDIQLSFSMDKCTVETITGSDETSSQLKVTIEYDSKAYEALSDAPIFTRSSYLSILGITSFIVDEPFDVFGPSSRKMVVADDWELSVDNNFFKGGIDYSSNLQELLDKLDSLRQHDKELMFSLLDRWRKARFLEKDTEESLLYNDEATLSYFHVLELLGDLSSKKLLNESKVLMESFCQKYNEEILSLSGVALDSETSAKAKLMSSVLDKDISVFAKISYSLKRYNLFDEKTSYWTKILIEARNSVAHGRRVFYDKAIYPVQPFFPLASNDMYPLEFLRIFTAKVISSHFEISLYDNEWVHVHEHLNYGEQATKIVLNAGQFEDPNQMSDLSSSIVFGGLNELILSKKIKVATCIDLYTFYLNSDIEFNQFMLSNVCALLVLLESTQEQSLIDTITNAISLMNANEDTSHVKFRDLIYYLDFHGFQTENLVNLEVLR